MKPFIVAEMSANHLGSFDRAMAIVEAAARAGASAVKLQTWDRMVIDETYVVRDGPWAGRNLADLYREAKTPWDWHARLFARCQQLGMVGFSTPFDPVAVEFLEALHCPMYKVASFEIVDLPLIARIAALRKPMILSTGMASEVEIQQALATARRAGATDRHLTVLGCTSAYPAPAAAALLPARLRQLELLGGEHAVGLSDHTLGIGVSVAAVALGAEVIEKHLTLSRSAGGPDAAFSLEPDEFALLVTECRRAAEATQTSEASVLGASHDEQPHLELRRSLYLARDVRAGQVLTDRDVKTARPALGMACRYLHAVIGRSVNSDAPKGTPLTPAILTDWS